MYMYPQRANIPLQGLQRRALTVGVISGPHCQNGAQYQVPTAKMEPSTVVPFHQSWIYMFDKKLKHSEKAMQLTLAIGGSDHA